MENKTMEKQTTFTADSAPRENANEKGLFGGPVDNIYQKVWALAYVFKNHTDDPKI